MLNPSFLQGFNVSHFSCHMKENVPDDERHRERDTDRWRDRQREHLQACSWRLGDIVHEVVLSFHLVESQE